MACDEISLASDKWSLAGMKTYACSVMISEVDIVILVACDEISFVSDAKCSWYVHVVTCDVDISSA